MNSTCSPYLSGEVAAPTSPGLSPESGHSYGATPPGSDPDLDPNKDHPRISYEGRVSLVTEAIYGKASSTPDDSCDDARRSPGSPGNGDGGDSDGPLDSLERLRRICRDALSGDGRSDPAPPDDGRDVLDALNEHADDRQEFRCPRCDFATRGEPAYRRHLAEEHDLSADDLEEERVARLPQVNSQGKVKTLKCKQCEYVTVTKEEFWRHVKGHIKPEKLLTCPKCMFVTEYKHHLEYHLRNHFGSKPFKCPQCNYSCVNKSMLSSHMKSHTAVYQYRCRDCSYATKYCHSLKLHLRKYAHKPAMVLNPDGTPNPLPIVDVYGTRRGPKIKRDDRGNIIGPPQAVVFQKLGQTARAVADSVGSLGSASLPSYVVQQLHQTLPPFGPGRTRSYSHDDPEDEPDDAEDDRQVRPDAAAQECGRPSPSNFVLFSKSVRSPCGRGVEREAFHNRCALCDFETNDPDIFRNHMVLHANRDAGRDAGDRKASPDAEKTTPQLSSSRHVDPHLPASEDVYRVTKIVNEEITFCVDRVFFPKQVGSARGPPDASGAASDYLDYLKQMAPLLHRGTDPAGAVGRSGGLDSPLGLMLFIQFFKSPCRCFAVSGLPVSPASVSPPPASPGFQSVHGGSLLSRLYLGSVVKSFRQRESPFAVDGDRDSNASSSETVFNKRQNGQKAKRPPLVPFLGGALDLSQGYEVKSGPTSGRGGNKRCRKGRAFKIERKSDSFDGNGDSSSVVSGGSGGSSEPEDSKSEESGGREAVPSRLTTPRFDPLYDNP
jgi:hypothetical protein